MSAFVRCVASALMLGLAQPARIVFEGRNEIQQRKFLKMRVNARMRPADWADD